MYFSLSQHQRKPTGQWEIQNGCPASVVLPALGSGLRGKATGQPPDKRSGMTCTKKYVFIHRVTLNLLKLKYVNPTLRPFSAVIIITYIYIILLYYFYFRFFITLQVWRLAGIDLVSVSRPPLTLLYCFEVSPCSPQRPGCEFLWEPGKKGWEYRQFS